MRSVQRPVRADRESARRRDESNSGPEVGSDHSAETERLRPFRQGELRRSQDPGPAAQGCHEGAESEIQGDQDFSGVRKRILILSSNFVNYCCVNKRP